LLTMLPIPLSSLTPPPLVSIVLLISPPLPPLPPLPGVLGSLKMRLTADVPSSPPRSPL
jgi:hypothetical protein